MSVQVHQDSALPNEPATPVEANPPVAPAVEPPAPVEGAEPPKEGEEPKAEPGADGETPPPAAFTPREKFKAWKEEHEVPKWMRDIIKDADTETQAIKLLEKAYGLDAMKPKYEETKVERDTIRGQHEQLLGYASELRQTFQRGDIDLWLEKLAIPPERMLQWALDKVNYSQLPPEQQRILDERTAAQREAYQLQQQLGQQGQQVSEQQRATLGLQLDTGLTRPDVQTFAEAFDAKAGKPNAFREEVISAGESAYARSNGKVLLSPDQAIQAVLEKYKNFVTPAQAAALPGQAPGAPGPRIVQPSGSAGTIPNVQGKPASPMKTSPSSLDDLKKIAREFKG